MDYGLTQGQLPLYSSNSNTRKWLPYYLAPLLNLQDAASIPAATNAVVKVFCCPAYQSSVGNLSDGGSGRSGDDPTANNYSVAYANTGVGSYTVTQPGNSTPYMTLLKNAYPTAAGWLPFGKEHSYEPMRLSGIAKAGVPLADFWEIGDYDSMGVSGANKYDLALTPTGPQKVRAILHISTGMQAIVRLPATDLTINNPIYLPENRTTKLITPQKRQSSL